jgi:hypothetical protein
MRRALTLLLGIWILAAPTLCLAMCPEPLAASSTQAATADPPQSHCHQPATGEESAPARESGPTPASGDDCCLEAQLEPAQVSAPESLRAPLTIAAGTLCEFADLYAATSSSAHFTPANQHHAPHLQTNPPLLI